MNQPARLQALLRICLGKNKFHLIKFAAQKIEFDNSIPEYILGYMNTTMLIKTNKALKQKAQKLAKEMGLPLGTLVNNYLRDFVVERKAIFCAPILNKKTQRIVDEARRDFKVGKNISGPFSTVEEFISHLKKL